MSAKITITLLLLLSFTNGFAQENYPGMNIIGKGYNIFGEFANTKSVMYYDLFDFSRMKQTSNAYGHELPKYVRIENISDHVIHAIEGSSKKEYISDLSQNMGLSGDAFFFKGSIESNFKEHSDESNAYFYYTYMDVNTKWRVLLDLRNIDTLIRYLEPQFASDLANLPPADLFELYGTHFVSNAYMGGRIDYSTVTTMNESVSETDLRVALSAKFKKIQGNIELDDESKSILSKIKTVENLAVVGGNSEFTNNIRDYIQYSNWAKGILTSPVLCGFDDKSLKPIWLLTKDVKRQKVLEDHFNNALLPKYPLPTSFTRDAILDNTDLTQEFNVYIEGFFITSDCDNYYLTGDEAGDFVYDIKIYGNNELIKQYKTQEGRVNRIWSGNWLSLKETVLVELPLMESSSITVYANLIEEDDLQTEYLGRHTYTHEFPFSVEDLSNMTSENGTKLWFGRFYSDTDCDATLYYNISEAQDQTAIDMGNKGWAEYEKGNYDQCLYYSKEALKIDNSLWYVQYNVALVYLVQGNPRAFDKYKEITHLCTDLKTFQAALKDIEDYEGKFGALPNSTPIKVLLKSKLK